MAVFENEPPTRVAGSPAKCVSMEIAPLLVFVRGWWETSPTDVSAGSHARWPRRPARLGRTGRLGLHGRRGRRHHANRHLDNGQRADRHHADRHDGIDADGHDADSLDADHADRHDSDRHRHPLGPDRNDAGPAAEAAA
jgi:hypothetical protein